MKTYSGVRDLVGCKVTVTDAAGQVTDLSMRLDLANLSPSGPEWGYRGSGPSQLALAIAADIAKSDAKKGDKYALEKYQVFRDLVIANLKQDTWTLSEAQILEFLV